MSNPSQPSEPTYVQFNPWRQEVNFLNEGGEPIHEPRFLDSPEEVLTAADTLHALTAELGTGVHPRTAVMRALGTSTMVDTSPYIRGLRRALPDALLGTTTDPNAYLRLGSMVVQEALRAPGDEQIVAERIAQREAAEAAELAARLAVLEAADAGKTDLRSYDHGVIRYRDQMVLLGFDTADELLYGRVLRVLTELPAGLRTDEQAIVQRVWDSMPVNERALLGDPIATTIGKVTTKGPAIARDIGRMFDTVRSHMGAQGVTIVRRIGGSAKSTEYEALDSDVTLELVEDVHTFEEAAGLRRLVVPPASRKSGSRTIGLESLQTVVEDLEIDDSDASLVTTAFLHGRSALTAESAVRALGIVMDPDGKRIVEQLVRTGELSAESADVVLDRIRGAVLLKLGYSGYRVAESGRTIGGSSWHTRNQRARGARLVTGQLPGETKAHIGEDDRPGSGS